jgi:hypothetical protein
MSGRGLQYTSGLEPLIETGLDPTTGMVARRYAAAGSLWLIVFVVRAAGRDHL